MPTYALLGATGSTGSAIVRCLLAQAPQNLTLKVYVRSRSKLLGLFPDLERTTSFKLEIIEGTSTDSAKLQQCLRDADAIFMCIAQNYAKPGTTLIYDAASTIIEALTALRKDQGSSYTTPTILQNRTASLNETLTRQFPWIAGLVTNTCLHYCYADIKSGCDLYASTAEAQPGLLDYIFMDAPALHDAEGTTPTGHKLILDEKQGPELSYADFGAAFVEAAERREEFAGKGVGVTATGPVKQTWGTLAGYLSSNLWSRIVAMR